MAYLMLEASVRTHPKFLKVGPDASWLWVCGLGYCQDGLTDGFIPHSALPFLGVKRAKKLAERLVSVRLWEVVEGGWQMHDYLEHNKSSEEIREIMRKRREGGKRGGRPPETLEVNLEGSPDSAQAETSEANLPVNPLLPTVLPVQPVQPERESTPPPRVALTSGGAGAGMNPRDHLRHSWCGDFRLCVPDWLHGQLLARIGGETDTRDERLRAFYEITMAGIPPDQTIGDRPVKFWEKAFEAAFPSAAPTKEGHEKARDRAAIDAKIAQGPPKRRELYQ